jgi:hypothetical protein
VPANDPVVMLVGETETFEVFASDPDAGDVLGYAWKVDGAAAGGQTASSMAYTAAAAGSHTVTVTVSDGNGGDASHTWNVTVNSSGPGDLNGDGIVNIDDLTLVISHFGQSSGDPGWDARADADGNGIVNIEDVGEVTGNYGRSYD